MELDVKYMQVNYRVYAQSILYLPGTSEEVTFKRRPENEETMKRIKGRRENRHKYSEAEKTIFTIFQYYLWTAAAAAKSLQSCPTLCDPIDGSPPGSPVPGNLQARTLEWDAISFSNAWKWKMKVKLLSRVRLPATPWTAAYQAPLSVGFFQARVLEWGAIAFSNLWTTWI